MLNAYDSVVAAMGPGFSWPDMQVAVGVPRSVCHGGWWGLLSPAVAGSDYQLIGVAASRLESCACGHAAVERVGTSSE